MAYFLYSIQQFRLVFPKIVILEDSPDQLLTDTIEGSVTSKSVAIVGMSSFKVYCLLSAAFPVNNCITMLSSHIQFCPFVA